MQHQLELWSASTTLQVSGGTTVIDDELAPRALAVDAAELERGGQSHLDALVNVYMRAARSERTHAAYASDWRSFDRWCDEHRVRALPAATSTLVRYLVHLAEQGKKASTIRRARIAIGVLHGQRGLPRPDHDDRIRTLERGIGRVHGTREEGANPLLVPELERMVRALGDSARDERDRALLLVGFAGAFRASDLVSLDVGDLELQPTKLRVRVRRSKEDQLRRGSMTDIPSAQLARLCPVAAIARWLKRVPDAGPLFRAVYGERVSSERLAPRAVSRAVQRVSARAGCSAGPDQKYSSHSLRAGLATSALNCGCSMRDLQVHGRWKDARSLERYRHVSAGAAGRTLAGLL
jgi:site-specific recombinase XerD